jgi:hypothetical protein
MIIILVYRLFPDAYHQILGKASVCRPCRCGTRELNIVAMVTPVRSGRTYLILMSLSISIAISCHVELALSISCKKIDTKIGMKIDIEERALVISVSIFDRIEQPLSISITISILKIDKSNARLGSLALTIRLRYELATSFCRNENVAFSAMS